MAVVLLGGGIYRDSPSVGQLTVSSPLSLTPSNNLQQLIAGDTRQIHHTETGASEWTVSAASLRITDPLGTVSVVTPYLESNIAALAQMVWINFTPTYGGVHQFKWTITASNGAVYDRVEYWIVNWSDLYETIRTLLQKPVADLGIGEVSMQFAIAYKILKSAYPVLPAYSDLTGDDQFFMDAGMSYLVGERLRLYKPSTVPTTPLVRIKQQTSEFGFASPAAIQSPSHASAMGSEFVTEGIRLIRKISAIKAVYDGLRAGNNAFHLFRLDGPSRQSLSNGSQPTLFSAVANMLATNVDLGTSFDWGVWSEIQ